MQRIINFLSSLTLADLWIYWANCVAIASLILIGLKWLDGLLQKWLPRRVLNDWFWGWFDKVVATFEYISASETKIAPKLPWQSKSSKQ